jgi:NitT/TauT family transport system substrate-binding protein
MKMTKKFIFITFAVILTISLAALSGCNKRAKSANASASVLSAVEKEAAFLTEPASQRVIRIGYSGGFCQAAVAIAQHKGYYAAEGLKTELTRSEDARDAIAGGKIDTSAGMIAGWLKPITNGIDLRFTVGLHTGCTSAFVLANSNITKFEKGQTVAISGGIGGVYHNQSYRFIANDGFVPEDFSWRDFPADQTLLILQSGRADVAVIGDQLAERWVSDGLLRRIRSLHEDPDFKDESCCVMGIAGPFLDENPVTSEKISRAVYKASLWIDANDENKAEAAKILLENGYISGTEEYAVQLFKLFRFGLPNSVTEKSLYDSVDAYQALGVIDKNINADDVKAQIWVPLDIESF